jgi:hypothetical protein
MWLLRFQGLFIFRSIIIKFICSIVQIQCLQIKWEPVASADTVAVYCMTVKRTVDGSFLQASLALSTGFRYWLLQKGDTNLPCFIRSATSDPSVSKHATRNVNKFFDNLLSSSFETEATTCKWLRRNVALLLYSLVFKLPITVAELSKAWTVFDRSNTGVLGSNPTWGMNVCVSLFCLCCLVRR